MTLQNQLIIFAKWPRAGQVKTRLAADIGTAKALQFYRKNTDDLMRRVGGDARWQTSVALTPDHAPALPLFGYCPVRSQGGGDLGARMYRAMAAAPPGPVIIVGSDIPGIRAAHIAKAFNLLGRNDAVIGPAHDGGYWLVGMRRRPMTDNPFSGVRWSSVHTLGDTLRNLDRRRVALIDTLVDVDRVDDLKLIARPDAAISQ
ncbi:MAG: TIGR04282 family arsenosugar biosynthesis glycosyltransferase [Alphaproteobacteria bacterium]